jgi:hypothetical protein
MPIIRVSCLPGNHTELYLRKLHKAIVAAVVSISELGLKGEEDMTTLLSPDMMQYGLGSDIIVEIFGLFEKPARTARVRNRLAEVVGKVLKDLYPKARVECFVSPFRINQGFWSSTQ